MDALFHGIALAVLALMPVAVAGGCYSDEDCSLNGICTRGTCACDAGWKGDTCGMLDLRPAQSTNAYGYAPNRSTWGGFSVQDREGTWHLYTSEIANYCTFSYWRTNSIVAYATSANRQGPYQRKGTVVGADTGTAAAAMIEEDGKDVYLVFHNGNCKQKRVANCSSHAADPDAPGVHSPSCALILKSNSPAGPWEGVDAPTFPYFSDGAVFRHPNGTWYIIDGNGLVTDSTSIFDICSAPHYAGPWACHKSKSANTTQLRNLQRQPGPLDAHWEDPFFWIDRRGHAHFIAHVYIVPDFRDPISGHAFSVDGVHWTYSNVQPYSNKIEQTDGTTLSVGSRERPKIAFKGRSGVTPKTIDDIVPVALHTAVNPNCGGRDKDQPGTDWTVHHIQPIGDSEPSLVV